MSYRIKTVSELTGIPINTISAWERRYDILHPDRDEGNGYRIYTDADVALLRKLKALVDQGYKISESVAMARQSRQPSAPLTAVDAVSQIRAELLRHLLAFDRPGAYEIRQRLILLPFKQAIDDVYLPILREIGDGWERGTVTIAQEHFASAWCRDQIVGILLAIGSDGVEGPTAVCAGFPGESHEIGILAVAVKLAIRGFRVQYFGADLPLADLLQHVQTHPPEFVCVSVMRTTPPRDIRYFAEQLQAGVPAGTRVVLGGPAVDGVAPVAGTWFAPRFEDLVSLMSSERSTRSVTAG